MDDQTITTTYGNADLPKGTPERPLVTFALFAYNQEQYIREAVEGAFSQTYEPLEIILSDDCSSDRTFEIMQEMAAAYEGPHRVIARQNNTNVGIIDHVLVVSALSGGGLLVVAAGDDVSLPHRSISLVREWEASRASALYSGCSDISDKGEVLKEETFPQPLNRVQELFRDCVAPKRYGGMIRNIPGYSAAYAKDMFSDLPLTQRKIHNEDALTTYLANLEGREIAFVEEVLVKRRVSETSISAASTFDSIEAVEKNEDTIQKFSASTVKFLDYFNTLPRVSRCPDSLSIVGRLESEREYLELVSKFWGWPLNKRLGAFMKFRDKKSLLFLLPRSFGKRVFCVIKFVMISASGKVR